MAQNSNTSWLTSCKNSKNIHALIFQTIEKFHFRFIFVLFGLKTSKRNFSQKNYVITVNSCSKSQKFIALILDKTWKDSLQAYFGYFSKNPLPSLIQLPANNQKKSIHSFFIKLENPHFGHFWPKKPHIFSKKFYSVTIQDRFHLNFMSKNQKISMSDSGEKRIDSQMKKQSISWNLHFMGPKIRGKKTQ